MVTGAAGPVDNHARGRRSPGPVDCAFELVTLLSHNGRHDRCLSWGSRVSEMNTPRMRRPSWRDPRLGVGVLLVVASVALGSWAVSSADATVSVYQAREALTPGDVIDDADLQVVQVRLDGVESVYLVPGSDLLPGSVVTRTIDAGELVPLASLGSADEIDVRPVQVPMSAALTDAVAKGTRVEIWAAMPDPASPEKAYMDPAPLVTGVEVADVYTDTSVFAGSDSVQIQVLVPVDDVSAVLAALAAEAQITVVPVPGVG